MAFPKHYVATSSTTTAQDANGSKRKLTNSPDASSPAPSPSGGKSVTFAPSPSLGVPTTSSSFSSRKTKRLKEVDSRAASDTERSPGEDTRQNEGIMRQEKKHKMKQQVKKQKMQRTKSPSPFRTKPTSTSGADTSGSKSTSGSNTITTIPNRASSTSSSFDRAELASAFALATLSKGGGGGGGSGSFSMGSSSGSFGATTTGAAATSSNNDKPRSPSRPAATGDVPMYIDQRFQPHYGIVTPEKQQKGGAKTAAATEEGSQIRTPMSTVPGLDAHMQQHQHRYGPPPPHMMLPPPPHLPPIHYFGAAPTPHFVDMNGHPIPPPGPFLHPSQYPYPPPPHMMQRQASDASGDTKNEGNSNNNKWGCDYCSASSFATFEEACAHEAVCKHRMPPLPGQPNTSADKGNKAQNFTSLARPKKHARQVSFALSRDDCPNSPSTEARTSSEDVRDDSGPLILSREVSLEPTESTKATYKSSARKESALPTDEEVNSIPIRPIPLCVSTTDATWLSDLNVYIRQNCVEAFTASDVDVARTSKRGRISLHQVGIRCRFCIAQPWEEGKNSAAASVSFPVSIGGIYESVKRWHRVHTEVCTGIPNETKERLRLLAESSVWVPTSRMYWVESAKALGMSDSPNGGIYFTKNPTDALAEYNSKKGLQRSSSIEASDGLQSAAPAAATMDSNNSINNKQLVLCTDKNEVSNYVYLLMSQVQPTTFSEADRFVARSKGPIGFAGFECKHCAGHAGLGKYFPNSVKSMRTNSTSQNIHSHLLKCRRVPQVIKAEIEDLKRGGRSVDTHLTNGWRRRFFDKVWERLHG